VGPTVEVPYDLIRIWLTGWTLARGTRPPERYHDGFRVEVGWPEQRRRFVFASLTRTVGDLARGISEPWVLIKACAPLDRLAEEVGPPWIPRPPGFLMTAKPEMSAVPLSRAYRLEERPEASARLVQVKSADNQTVALGRVVMVEGYAIYDRIETRPEHRRRGLATAVMGELQALAIAAGAHTGVLVATTDGRALYERLGWRLRSPYSTIVIPG
jgi:GNAT superfamily N-acetyltransferase